MFSLRVACICVCAIRYAYGCSISLSRRFSRSPRNFTTLKDFHRSLTGLMNQEDPAKSPVSRGPASSLFSNSSPAPSQNHSPWARLQEDVHPQRHQRLKTPNLQPTLPLFLFVSFVVKKSLPQVTVTAHQTPLNQCPEGIDHPCVRPSPSFAHSTINDS